MVPVSRFRHRPHREPDAHRHHNRGENARQRFADGRKAVEIRPCRYGCAAFEHLERLLLGIRVFHAVALAFREQIVSAPRFPGHVLRAMPARTHSYLDTPVGQGLAIQLQATFRVFCHSERSEESPAWNPKNGGTYNRSLHEQITNFTNYHHFLLHAAVS